SSNNSWRGGSPASTRRGCCPAACHRQTRSAPARYGPTEDSYVAARDRRGRDDPPARENRSFHPSLAAATAQSGTPSSFAVPSVGPQLRLRPVGLALRDSS